MISKVVTILLTLGLIHQLNILPGILAFLKQDPYQVPTIQEKEFVGRHCFLRNTVSSNPYYKLYDSYIDEVPISVIIMKTEDPKLWALALERETLGFYVVITGKMKLSTEHYTCKNL
jgi:hypothetical protein